MSNPPKQKWLDNLYGIMSADIVLKQYVWEFKNIADKYYSDVLSKEDALLQMENLKKMLIPQCEWKYHCEKLINGVIQFTLNKDFEY